MIFEGEIRNQGLNARGRMSIYEKTLNEYLEAAASKSHTPGGGSVSAVVGANAASMVSMVANLTIGKKKYAEVQEEAQAILLGATAAIEELSGSPPPTWMPSTG
jgi:formiminotetrahydrofolate cyclodeaminase